MSKEKNSFSEWLKQPYPAVKDTVAMIRPSVLFGLFIFLFLFVFKPFGVNSVQRNFFLICLGYGLITSVVMIVLNAVFPALFKSFFKEEKWNTGRELWWNLVNIFFIGLANCLYSIYTGMTSLDINSIFIFEGYTLAIGIIPVTVAVLVKESQKKKHFSESSEVINETIEKKPLPASTAAVEKIRLSSESQNDLLELYPEQILYLAASDNYIEVYYRESDHVRKKLLRIPLKSACENLKTHSQIYRCHKSYAVNLDQVNHVSGNAQGYKLHLKNIEFTIPVSRANNTAIKDLLSR